MTFSMKLVIDDFFFFFFLGNTSNGSINQLRISLLQKSLTLSKASRFSTTGGELSKKTQSLN